MNSNFWQAPVLKVSATQNNGIEQIIEQIYEHSKFELQLLSSAYLSAI